MSALGVNAEIKDCPFCGGKPSLINTKIYIDTQGIIKNGYRVICNGCGSSTKECASFIFQNKDGEIKVETNGALEAIAWWNRRHKPEKWVKKEEVNE